MNTKTVSRYYETEEGIPLREDQYEGSKNVRQWILAEDYDKLIKENQRLRKVLRNIANGKVGDQLIMRSDIYAAAHLKG